MMKDRQALPVRHIPRRTCLGCRQVKAKRELVRVVCLPSGEVEIDLTGKKSGRGAYLCAERPCWDEALKANRLDHALKTKLTLEHRTKLVEYAQRLNNTTGSGKGAI